MQVTFDPERFDRPTLKLECPEEVDRLDLLARGVDSSPNLDPRISTVASYIIIEAINFRGDGVERLEGEPIEFTGQDYDSLINLLKDYPTYSQEFDVESEAREIARQCWQEWGPMLVAQKESEAA